MSPWSARREAERLHLGEMMAREISRRGRWNGPSLFEIADDSMIEVLARLPFAMPTDSREHGFAFPDRALADSAPAFWKSEGAFVFVSTLTIDAPWVEPARPGLVKSFQVIRTGKPGSGWRGLLRMVPAQLPGRRRRLNSTGGPLDTWLCARGPAASLVDQEDPVLAVLELGLAGLNRMIRAVRLVQRGTPLRQISMEDLEILVFAQVLNPDGTASGHFSVPMQMDCRPQPRLLTPEDNASVDTVIDMQGQFHPFILHRDWFERAQYELQHGGDLLSAVISLQTAIECLLLALLRMLGVDEGRTSSELAPLVNDPPPFKTQLTTHLPAKLGGSWVTTAGPVGTYWNDLYLLRNRIVHGGHVPTHAEGVAAVASFDGLMDHILDRLRSKWKKYPRTLVTLAGIDGLERRGWMSTALRAKVEELKDEGPAIWLPDDVAGRS